jgi:hypothetical protein
MPIIETPLMHGSPAVNWDRQRATTSIRCQQCRTVYPGRYMKEVNPETMRCRECEGKGAPHDDRRTKHPDASAWWAQHRVAVCAVIRDVMDSAKAGTKEQSSES